MSHFTVMVIGDNPEALLEPYDEQAEGEFQDCTDEVMEKWNKNEAEEILDGKTPQEYYENVKKFASDYYGYRLAKDYDGEEERYGVFGITFNENGKWDWYSLGGRWKGFFIHKAKKDCKYPKEIKKGECGVGGEPEGLDKRSCDQLRKCDIDLVAMLKKTEDNAREYWKEAQTRGLTPWDEENIKGMTEDEYAATSSEKMLEVFAIVDDDGWHEKGSMGWWGMVKDRKEQQAWRAEFEKKWNAIPEDTLISVYDCHV